MKHFCYYISYYLSFHLPSQPCVFKSFEANKNLYCFLGKSILLLGHVTYYVEIEISDRPFAKWQKKKKNPACIYAFLLFGRYFSPVKCFHRVMKQISVSGMTAPTLQYVNEGP
jgi:hypothetical protein